jgi:hypothetical protein
MHRPSNKDAVYMYYTPYYTYYTLFYTYYTPYCTIRTEIGTNSYYETLE